MVPVDWEMRSGRGLTIDRIAVLEGFEEGKPLGRSIWIFVTECV